jgi:hypothetical protein
MGQTSLRETRKREIDIERSFAKRVEHVQSLIDNKWKERKVLASKIIGKK